MAQPGYGGAVQILSDGYGPPPDDDADEPDDDERDADAGDAYLHDGITALGLPSRGDGLDWPVALEALPQPDCAQLRRQIDAIVRMAIVGQDIGQPRTADIRRGQSAVRQFRARLYAKEGGIPQVLYLEADQFLRRLKLALEDLRKAPK
jgi:hypothetical protein